jgi:sec-independent protein translocase protein TatA
MCCGVAFAARPFGGVFVSPLFAFFGLGTTELIIVGVVVLLLFGSRLPKVMRSLGEGIVEFKRGVQGIEDTSGDGPRDPGASDVR